MSLSDIVSVQITTESVGVQQAGFGTPLILAHTPSWVERVREYASVDEVADDFLTTDPEYLMASAIFSQTPSPSSILIGRCANKPTQKFTIAVSSVSNSTDYTITLNNVEYTYTSDANATNDEIIDGLAALIDDDFMTATTPGSSGSHTLVLTADTAGTFSTCEVADVDLLSIAQNHADPGVEADLIAIALERSDFYFILNPFNSKAMALEIADYAIANDKVFVGQTCDSDNITLAIGVDTTTSLMGQAKTSAYDHVALIYHPDLDEFADAAWVGRCAPLDPGSETWKFKTLNGVSAVTLTTTQQTNIDNKSGNHYQIVAGKNISAEGVVSSGEFIDVIRFRDFLVAQISESVFAALTASNKVPYTDEGVAVIEAAVRSVLIDAVTGGGLSADPAPVVTVPKVASVSDADKTARILRNVKFTATLAGAIHKSIISGVVSV